MAQKNFLVCIASRTSIYGTPKDMKTEPNAIKVQFATTLNFSYYIHDSGFGNMLHVPVDIKHCHKDPYSINCNMKCLLCKSIS